MHLVRPRACGSADPAGRGGAGRVHSGHQSRGGHMEEQAVGSGNALFGFLGPRPHMQPDSFPQGLPSRGME